VRSQTAFISTHGNSERRISHRGNVRRIRSSCWRAILATLTEIVLYVVEDVFVKRSGP